MTGRSHEVRTQGRYQSALNAAALTRRSRSSIDPACQTSYLSYDNFGAPFVINWCRGCHSTAVPADMRQKAPIEVNLDNLDQVRAWGPRIVSRATGSTPSMPPAGGPSEQERALLAEWLTCGMR